MSYRQTDRINSPCDIDLKDYCGIHDSNIYNCRDKIPTIQDCPRCREKVALMVIGGDPDYYNFDSSLHECSEKCYGCGADILYSPPGSRAKWNKDQSEYELQRGINSSHECPYSQNALRCFSGHDF